METEWNSELRIKWGGVIAIPLGGRLGIDSGLWGCEALQIIIWIRISSLCVFIVISPRTDPSDSVILYTIKGRLGMIWF